MQFLKENSFLIKESVTKEVSSTVSVEESIEVLDIRLVESKGDVLVFFILNDFDLLFHLIPLFSDVLAVLHLGFQIELYNNVIAVLVASVQSLVSTGEKIL